MTNRCKCKGASSVVCTVHCALATFFFENLCKTQKKPIKSLTRATSKKKSLSYSDDACYEFAQTCVVWIQKVMMAYPHGDNF